ncbi:MAG: hypothetical protein JJE46_12230 [Acidimicrobiia bacterium]|nr:hypothetical protein [Acidimicrobiia bacterium]
MSALRWLANRLAWETTLDALRVQAATGASEPVTWIQLAPAMPGPNAAPTAEPRVDRVA